jgi:tuberculosinol/isotuberculosinol synthase
VNAATFRTLPLTEVARLVREAGPKVAVFPINGTRRWFVLEHPLQPDAQDDPIATYLDVAGRRHIELYRLLFDHGLDTLLTPVFGSDLLARGEEYMQAIAVEGLVRLATHPDFLDFYRAYQVRVRFYGDHRKFFAPTPYAYVSDLFDQATAQTSEHGRYRLFFGVCADDPTGTVAELAIRYHAEHGRVPDKRTLIELYYGESVEPVDLFIGFDKFCVFDMPLVATGTEDLYFTVAPSPYLAAPQLRTILYDHLYSRREKEPDHAAMRPEDWALMREFYHVNRDRTLGVGAQQAQGGFWYPLPQVELPASFAEALH